jgi:Tfp pilus assembly protein PilF
MRCSAWGCGGARKDNDAAERYYRQALRMDSGNSNAVRGLANIYRAQSPEKASQFIQSFPPASVAALMILNVA